MEVREDAAPIVIVDDASEDAVLLRRMLQQCKLLNPVIVFHEGAEFIGALQNSESAMRPVLVLLDLVMAPMSGIGVLQAMNRLQCIKDIPVVMLSGIRDINTIRDGYQLGAQTFLIKPIAAEDIIQSLAAIPRIRIEDVAGGYVLHPASATTSPRASESDTSFFRKGPTSFSA